METSNNNNNGERNISSPLRNIQDYIRKMKVDGLEITLIIETITSIKTEAGWMNMQRPVTQKHIYGELIEILPYVLCKDAKGNICFDYSVVDDEIMQRSRVSELKELVWVVENQLDDSYRHFRAFVKDPETKLMFEQSNIYLKEEAEEEGIVDAPNSMIDSQPPQLLEDFLTKVRKVIELYETLGRDKEAFKSFYTTWEKDVKEWQSLPITYHLREQIADEITKLQGLQQRYESIPKVKTPIMQDIGFLTNILKRTPEYPENIVRFVKRLPEQVTIYTESFDEDSPLILRNEGRTAQNRRYGFGDDLDWLMDEVEGIEVENTPEEQARLEEENRLKQLKREEEKRLERERKAKIEEEFDKFLFFGDSNE